MNELLIMNGLKYILEGNQVLLEKTKVLQYFKDKKIQKKQTKKQQQQQETRPSHSSDLASKIFNPFTTSTTIT